ncbi:MAG: L-serine ammonia-lyase, iron-sulfur-dependent, subunit alpha [Oscillospiraceae bacterium]
MIEFNSIKEIVDLATEKNTTISQVVLQSQAEQMKKTQEEIFIKMRQHLRLMKESALKGISDERSASGLTGGMALQFHNFNQKGKLLGPLAANAIEKALAISEQNACMGRIVACPTAGSCGILPAVLLAVGEEYNFDEDKLTYGLLNASGIGMIIAKNASVSGAQGGCQAECGSASAMAASAIVELLGGTPQMSATAVALCFKFVMGLVCDPVAGLVEVPCVKRNASGAINSLTAAEIALAGIESKIPVDEVVWAMDSVGNMMSDDLKETARGGLAATPTAKKIHKELNEKHKLI